MDLKRKVGEDSSQDSQRKRKKQWRVPKKNDDSTTPSRTIQPGDSGIWATCDKGREGKCIGELRDLFSEYAERLYGDGDANETIEGSPSGDGIENDIQAEIEELHEPKTPELFTPLRVNVQCVVFLKTEPPLDPVTFVKKICEDAINNPTQKRTRFVKRLSPMTLTGRASQEGLETVARTVLAPHFHQQPFLKRKFAIRPTLRNHNILTRDSIIKQVATIIGPGHAVDLKDYDLLVVVEVYQNICGVSVLDNHFDSMKRYNLAEIFNPTPKEQVGLKNERPMERPSESEGIDTASAGSNTATN